MSGIDLTRVMQRLYASEINCVVQGQWDAGFVVSIGGDTRYGSSDASETFSAGEGGSRRMARPESPRAVPGLGLCGPAG